MKKTPLLSALALAASMLAVGSAQSATVSLSGITASWYDAVPTVSITNNGTTAPKARWGTPAQSGGQQSGYDYVVAAQPITFVVPPSPSPDKVLGTFTHVNYPITGTSLSSIKLSITASVSIDPGNGDPISNQGTKTFHYGFNHWETPNNDNPCANGQPNGGSGVNKDGCADRVIANWLSTSDSFTVNGDIYTLNVLGFSLNTDGSSPFTQFWTAENKSNNAYLVGNVTLRRDLLPPEEIPEPASLALVGLGLLGAAAARRRRRD